MPVPFAEYATRVQEHLERDYGIHVITRDIPDPLTGDLNGEEIDIDYAVTPEQRLFLLAHLFGHTVQWNVDSGAYDIGRQYKPPVDESLIPAVLAYEGDAARYGLEMLHIPAWTDRGTAVLTGQADYSPNVSLETHAEGLKRKDIVGTVRYPGEFNSYQVFINNERKPFNDPRVRRAFHLGNDHPDLVDIAPRPVLAGLDRADDRMAGRLCVRRRVPGG